MSTWRKYIALLLSALLVCALFAGCGGEKPDEGEAAKEMVIIIGGVPKLIDPAKYSSTYESYIVYNTCNTLVSYSNDLTDIVPCLGELKSISEDGMCYTFSYTINIQHLLSLVKLLNTRRIHRNVRL